MNSKILLTRSFQFFVFFFILCLQANSQVGNYTFAQTSVTYTEITGGTSLIPASASFDEENFLNNAIGFTFKFNGVDYTTFGINSNGYLWFGNGNPELDPLVGAYPSDPISNSTSGLGGTGTISGIISPLGRDLINRTTGTTLSIQTIGTAPNRICVVQFKNFRGYAIGTGAIYNFQISMSETSNLVKFTYGSFTGGTTLSADFQVGLRGLDNTDFINVVADATNWAGAVLGTTNDAASTIGTAGSGIYPSSGTCFTFTPGALATCIKPSNVIATAVTSASENIKWNKVASAARYEWAVTTSITPPTSGTTLTATNNDTSVVASGLTAATQYYAHVRSICGGTDISAWTTKPFFSIRENDICSGATDITSKISANFNSITGNNTTVTAGFEGSGSPALCSSISTGFINDVWYKFTAPAGSDSIIITGASGTSSDWVFQVFDACNGNQIACSDDGDVDNPFGNSLMPLIGMCGLTPGSTYFVRAYPYSASSTATCELYIYKGGACPAPPINDNCVNAVAIDLTCVNGPVSGTTVNASASNVTNTSCGGTFSTQTDVWYKFNSGNSNMVPFVKISNIDTGDAVTIKEVYLSVYHGSSCNNLIYDGCLSRTSGNSDISAYLFGAISNTDYYVRVYSTLTSEQTTFDISVCDSTRALSIDTTGQSATSSCLNVGNINISGARQNNNKWVRIVNSGLIAEINANGQELGATNIQVTRNTSGAIRRDASRTAPLLGREYMDRNVTITPTTQPTAPVSVRIYFTATELNALIAAGGDGYADVSSINSLVVTKNQQTCAAFAGGNNEVRIIPTSNGTFADGAYVEFQVSSFSTFFLHGGLEPLPVSITSFNAQRNGKSNVISWTTTQEMDVNRFVVERSADGRSFTAIGQVNPASRANNNSYNFTDNAPLKGYNYYRLKIVENSNQEKYSAIKSIRNEGSVSLSAYPNPVQNHLQVSVNAEKSDRGTLQIIDLSGKVVYTNITTIAEGSNNININTSNFSTGAYVIKLQLSEEVIIKKFNKH